MFGACFSVSDNPSKKRQNFHNPLVNLTG